jgi:hypothetical protein
MYAEFVELSSEKPTILQEHKKLERLSFPCFPNLWIPIDMKNGNYLYNVQFYEIVDSVRKAFCENNVYLFYTLLEIPLGFVQYYEDKLLLTIPVPTQAPSFASHANKRPQSSQIRLLQKNG